MPMINQYNNQIINTVLKQIEESDELLTKKKEKELRHLLKNISDKEIIECIGMAEMPLIAFILKIKYGKPIKLIPYEDEIVLKIGRFSFANMSYLAVYLHFLELKGDILTLEGNISFPAALEEIPSFYIKHNSKVINVPLIDKNLDLKLGNQVYEWRKTFNISIALEGKNEIVFYNRARGLECEYGKINSMRFFPIADNIPAQYASIDGWILRINENCLECNLAEKGQTNNCEELFQSKLKELYPAKADWAISLRNSFFQSQKNKKRPIWLFLDRTDQAGDNAFVFFKYMQVHPEIDSFFIISENSDDFAKVSLIGKTVPLYSQQHYELALKADFIISSQCNGAVENPFWEDAEFFRDIYHRPKRVFLQHGVIQNDMSTIYNRFNTGLTGFVTSTEEENRSILEYPYDYSENEVWLTGLPRFDELYNATEKYILITLSWRNWLAEQIWDPDKKDMIWVIKSGFERSEYYCRLKALINNTELISNCKKNGYKIALKLHPILKSYLGQIFNSDICQVWNEEVSYKDAFAKSSIMVTDYSSVAFDFAYLNKPVVYYQFDKKEFFSDHYKPGYYQYEKDGFGPVFEEERELVGFIVRYLNDEINDNSFRKGSFKFEGQHCKKIYEKIMEKTFG